MRDLLGVLGEPRRRRLLELLLAGEKSVNELVSQFDVSQSAISQHLAVLAEAGLVSARRQGRYRYYSVRHEGLANLHAALELFWTKELDDLVTAQPHQP